jgi:hypothetical protein
LNALCQDRHEGPGRNEKADGEGVGRIKGDRGKRDHHKRDHHKRKGILKRWPPGNHACEGIMTQARYFILCRSASAAM